MTRRPPWTVLGVPVDSIAPKAGGPRFGTERSPDALRACELASRLGARDLGDLDVRIVGAGRDQVTGIVGWPSVATVTSTIRRDVGAVLAGGGRPLLLGGCCSILMGAGAAVRDTRGRFALAYVDGHLDMYDHVSSPTGEAADMPLGALLGLGWPSLLATMGSEPVLAGADVTVLGARDETEAADIGDLPGRLAVTVHGPADIAEDPGGLAESTRERFTAAGVPFWLHLDVDVLDESVFGATDYLLPGGLDLSTLAELLRPLGRADSLLGASVGCYNPDKDPDGSCAVALADLLVDVLGDQGRR